MKWEPEAEERLKKVPFFVRAMAKSATEKLAQDRGLDVVTADLMKELRGRAMGGARHPGSGNDANAGQTES